MQEIIIQDNTPISIDTFFVRIDKSNYPKYDILFLSNTCVEIHIALAGFVKEDIRVMQADAEITIAGSKQFQSKLHYLLKGISTRSFAIYFHVKPGVKCEHIKFINGMLYITLIMQITSNISYIQIQ